MHASGVPQGLDARRGGESATTRLPWKVNRMNRPRTARVAMLRAYVRSTLPDYVDGFCKATAEAAPKSAPGMKNTVQTTNKLTLAVVAGLYLKHRTDLRPSTYKQWAPYFTGYYFQPLHNLPMDEVTREQIQTRIDQVVIQSGPRAAQHCWVIIRLLFKWA